MRIITEAIPQLFYKILKNLKTKIRNYSNIFNIDKDKIKKINYTENYQELKFVSNLLDKESVDKVITQIHYFEKKQISLKAELKNIKEEFEKLFKYISTSAEANDDLKNIQCFIDSINKIDLNSEISIDIKVKLVLEKVSEVILQIKEFQNKYENKEKLPEKIFKDLKHILKKCTDNLAEFDNLITFIKTQIAAAGGMSLDLEVNSNKDTLKIWAEKLEPFAEGIEELCKLSIDLPLGTIENLGIEIMNITKRTNYSINKRESFRQRVRNTGLSLLNSAKKARLNSLNNNSAEKKAGERINSDEEINWITDIILDESINIEEIINTL